MSFLDRLRSAFTPCNHVPEIERLTSELQDVALERDDKERKLETAIVFIKDLREQLEAANSKRLELEASVATLQVEVETLNELYETNYHARVSAEVNLESVQTLLTDTAAALEEAQSRIALFENPPREEQLEIDLPPTEVLWQIVGLAFDARRVWIVRRPGEKEPFKVPIRDHDFYDRVHARDHTFGEGDVLRTRTHTLVTLIAPEQRKADHTIVEVLAVLNQPAHEQTALTEAAAEGDQHP